MISIDPTKNSERDNYKLLIGSVIPRPVAFVTTQSEEGIVNGAPFSYFNIVSSNPPMVSLAIQRPNDQLKDTASNIYNNQEFVVHIVDDENVVKINETAASLPATESEIELANLTLVQSEIGNVIDLKLTSVGSAKMGVGTVHHIAWRASDDEDLLDWKKHVEGFEYGVTSVRDRNYFIRFTLKSMGKYCLKLQQIPQDLHTMNLKRQWEKS